MLIGAFEVVVLLPYATLLLAGRFWSVAHRGWRTLARLSPEWASRMAQEGCHSRPPQLVVVVFVLVGERYSCMKAVTMAFCGVAFVRSTRTTSLVFKMVVVKLLNSVAVLGRRVIERAKCFQFPFLQKSNTGY